MKKLDDKDITTYVIRKKGLMPQSIVWKSNSLENLKGVWPMTALRQNAIMELEKIPEDKLSFVIQIMQGVNGLYNDSKKERKEAFARLEQLRKKGTVTDYDAEIASYREDKYGKQNSNIYQYITWLSDVSIN